MMTIEELKSNVENANLALEAARKALNEFEESPENNVFKTVDEAHSVLFDRLRDQAFNDCEGAYNVGQPEYRQEFIVDGKHYVAIAKFEYNRHDKMYYYIDGHEYIIEPA